MDVVGTVVDKIGLDGTGDEELKVNVGTISGAGLFLYKI
jgi:hypothetical protein